MVDNKVIAVLLQQERSENVAIASLLLDFLARGGDTVALRRDGGQHLAHLKALRTQYMSDASNCTSALDEFVLLNTLLGEVQNDLDAFSDAYPLVVKARTVARL